MTDIIVTQETEYGIRFPSGKEIFADGRSPDQHTRHLLTGDLTTRKGRDKAQAKYEKLLADTGVALNDAKLEFVQRVRTETLSATIPLPLDASSDVDDLVEAW